MKSALIAAVLVASAALATSAAARKIPPAAPQPNPPISKDGIDISILPHIGAGGSAGVTEVGLDLEAKTPDAAARMGFQSLHAVTDVDCGRGSNRFVSAVAYQQPALGGPGKPRNITGAWVQPSSDSYMAAVIARVCAAQAAAPDTRPPPVVKEMAAAPPAAPPPQPAPQPAPTPTPAAASAAAAPTPMPPEVAKFSGSHPVAAPTEAAPPATASAPPPSGPLVVKFGGGASPAPMPPPAPAFLPKVAGDRIAQVAASADLQDAEKVLRELKPLIAAPLTTSVEQALVGGAHVYRADVIGFQTAAEAKAFCKSAAHVSKTCWVRAKSDAPAKAAAKPPEHLRPAKRAG